MLELPDLYLLLPDDHVVVLVGERHNIYWPMQGEPLNLERHGLLKLLYGCI